jgi:hypothetical protein
MQLKLNHIFIFAAILSFVWLEQQDKVIKIITIRLNEYYLQRTSLNFNRGKSNIKLKRKRKRKRKRNNFLCTE